MPKRIKSRRERYTVARRFIEEEAHEENKAHIERESYDLDQNEYEEDSFLVNSRSEEHSRDIGTNEEKENWEDLLDEDDLSDGTEEIKEDAPSTSSQKHVHMNNDDITYDLEDTDEEVGARHFKRKQNLNIKRKHILDEESVDSETNHHEYPVNITVNNTQRKGCKGVCLMKEDFQCRKKKDDDVKNDCKDKEMKTLDKVSSIETKQKESTSKMEADLQNCAVEIKKKVTTNRSTVEETVRAYTEAYAKLVKDVIKEARTNAGWDTSINGDEKSNNVSKSNSNDVEQSQSVLKGRVDSGISIEARRYQMRDNTSTSVKGTIEDIMSEEIRGNCNPTPDNNERSGQFKSGIKSDSEILSDVEGYDSSVEELLTALHKDYLQKKADKKPDKDENQIKVTSENTDNYADTSDEKMVNTPPRKREDKNVTPITPEQKQIMEHKKLRCKEVKRRMAHFRNSPKNFDFTNDVPICPLKCKNCVGSLTWRCVPARFEEHCPKCSIQIRKEDCIVKVLRYGWIHTNCPRKVDS